METVQLVCAGPGLHVIQPKEGERERRGFDVDSILYSN